MAVHLRVIDCCIVITQQVVVIVVVDLVMVVVFVLAATGQSVHKPHKLRWGVIEM